MEQRIVRWAISSVAGILALGTLLDAVANIRALTIGQAKAAAIIVVALWLVVEYRFRRRQLRWRASGMETTVVGIGTGPRLAVLGALAALAYSGLTNPESPPGADPSTQGKARLMLLAPQIERHLRQFMAATGFHNRVSRGASLPDEVEAISETWPMSETFKESVRRFWSVKERVARGYDVDEKEISRAIDSGELILRTLETLKREKKTVAYVGVELFADAEGLIPRVGVWGLVLENVSSDGKETTSFQVFPTSRTDYAVGDEVTWDFGGPVVGETWFRNPRTSRIEHAWQGSMQFEGQPLREVNAKPRS